jgi:purine-binding chemotaxis protein CheW
MSAPVDETRVELACFAVGGQRYGVDVHQVREIVRGEAVTVLPHAPPLVEGVIDLRGAIVPVIDLGRALGGAPVGEGAQTRIAIVEARGLAFGLRVAAAAEVLAAAAADVGDPPPLVAQAGYEMVQAVVRRPGAAPVLVLSLEHLLERIYRSAGAAEAQG